MSDTLDLDQLIPEPKTVKVNGKVYELKPLKLKTLLNLQKILSTAKDKSNEEMLTLMDDMFASLKPIVPDIEEMDLTLPQTLALMDFIYRNEQATQGSEAKTVEKKTEPSPTQ